MIANKMSIEEIREHIGADSLYYLSEEGLKRALNYSPVCLACFNGDYPIDVSPKCSKKDLEVKM